MKTDDEIQREKEAVQRMVGAKSAMETALSRIDRLEKTVDDMAMLLDDAAKNIGDGLHFYTHHTGEPRGEAKYVSLRIQLSRIASIGRGVR